MVPYAASPMPTAARAHISIQNDCTAPDRPVAKLQQATPSAISRGRERVSPSAPKAGADSM